MSEYLIIDLLIIAVPLIMSFEKKIYFIKRIRFVSFSIIIVSTAYILWDIAAVIRGNWSFNPEYISNIYFGGLPVEEWLFFLVVPYSMLFLYTTAGFYFKDYKITQVNPSIVNLVTMVLLIPAFLFLDNDYTFAAFLSAAAFFFTAVRLYPELLASTLYWKFIAFSFIPFFAVNLILTGLPIVQYNIKAITGIRIFTVPLEDLLYSFSMISFYILFYKLAERKWEKKEQQ